MPYLADHASPTRPARFHALRCVWNGTASRTFYVAFWMPLQTILWGGCLFMAWRAYPGYEMTLHDVSDLGHPRMNPKGWWFWSTGMAVASVMMAPLAAFASRRMKSLVSTVPSPVTHHLVALGSMGLRGSCLGLMGLALAPQGGKSDLLHQVAGTFAFGGMYLTLLYLWLVPLARVRRLSAPRWMLLAVSAWWGVAGFLGTQGYRFLAYGELGHDLKHRPESVLLRFSLWEWMLLAASSTAFPLLIALLPGDEKRTLEQQDVSPPMSP